MHVLGGKPYLHGHAGEDEIGKSETVTIELWDYRLKNQFQGGVTLALKVPSLHMVLHESVSIDRDGRVATYLPLQGLSYSGSWGGGGDSGSRLATTGAGCCTAAAPSCGPKRSRNLSRRVGAAAVKGQAARGAPFLGGNGNGKGDLVVNACVPSATQAHACCMGCAAAASICWSSSPRKLQP